MIKIKKQTVQQPNKQTNRQRNIFLGLKYISKISSDLYETFRKFSWEYPEVIQIKKINKQTNEQKAILD